MISKRGKFRELSKNRDTRPAPSSTQHNEHQRRPRPPPPFPVLLASGEHPTDEGLAEASTPPARPPCSELHPSPSPQPKRFLSTRRSRPRRQSSLASRGRRLPGLVFAGGADGRDAKPDSPARPQRAGDQAARHPQGPPRVFLFFVRILLRFRLQ
jgi:hypothetical protein